MSVSTLYIYTQEGCPACVEAKRELREFKRRHLLDVLTLELNTTRRDWSIQGYSPSATPAYALVRDRQIVKRRSGAMTADELDDWIAGDAA